MTSYICSEQIFHAQNFREHGLVVKFLKIIVHKNFARYGSYCMLMGLKKLYLHVIVRVVGDVPFGVGRLPVR